MAHAHHERSGRANPKTELVAFAQRKCGRSMLKDDIVYTVKPFGDKYQSTVRLNCIEGKEFAGELASTDRLAMQNAATQALSAFAEEFEALRLPQKRALTGADGEESAAKLAKVSSAADEDGDEKPSVAVKSRLHTCCVQILGRALADGDIVYEVDAVGTSQQARLTLPNLPGELGRMTWTGALYSNKRDTKLNAAEKAVEAILADPELGPKIDMSLAKLPAEGGLKKNKSVPAQISDLGVGLAEFKGKGKGKSKGPLGKGGKMAGKATMMHQLMAWWCSSWGPAAMLKGKAKGKAKGDSAMWGMPEGAGAAWGPSKGGEDAAYWGPSKGQGAAAWGVASKEAAAWAQDKGDWSATGGDWSGDWSGGWSGDWSAWEMPEWQSDWGGGADGGTAGSLR